MATTMRAVRFHQFGGVEQLKLEEVPRPSPGPGEVLVKVHAAGVNPVDWKTRRGGGVASMLKRPLPITPGWDVAGTVAEVGWGCWAFRPGEPVFGMVRIPGEGTYAEYVTLPAEHLARKPETLSFEEAAAVPLAGLTAWQAMFEAAGLRPGESVLIHGGAGGVGHLAVQLARGSRVTATASPANHGFLRELGAERVLDYHREALDQPPGQYDVVLDAVGGEALQRSYAALKQGGRLVSIVGPPDAELARRLGIEARFAFVRPSGEQLAALAKRLDARELRLVLAGVLPLEQAAEAHARGETGHTRGKLVLKVS